MTEFDPNIHHRRSIRLQDYDYSQAGAYFITICAHEHKCIFGRITNGVMHPNELGEIVVAEWLRTSVVRPNVELDHYVIMPNHLHGIIVLSEGVGATRWVARLDRPVARATHRVAPTGPDSGSVGAIVGQFKSIVTKRMIRSCDLTDLTIWQRNYHEHVIRNEHDLARIREYVINNSLKWELDRYYVK